MKYSSVVLLFAAAISTSIATAQVAGTGNTDVSESMSLLVQQWLGEPVDVPNKCGLPAVTHFLQNKNRYTEAASMELANALSRPVAHTSVLRGAFRIHFDTSGIHEPAILDENHNRIPGTARRFVDSVGAIVNYVLQFQRDSLGFLPPPQDNGAGGGPEYDIYIQSFGGSMYGSTTPESPINNKPEGGTFTTFMMIDNDFEFVTPDSIKGLPALRVTLAHELHHSIQIGNYGYWTSDIYYYELTSVWMEEAVYTSVNDYYSYLRSSQGHFRNPGVPFNANSFIMYSRGIWGIFLEKRFGPGTMLRTWENISTTRPLDAINIGLQTVGAGLRQAFGEWSVWNFHTDVMSDPDRYYPEGEHYPRVVQLGVSFSPPSRTIIGSLRFLSTRYHEILGGQDTLRLITSNVNLPAALSGNNNLFAYAYQLNSNRIDNSYVSTVSRIFVKFEAPDRQNWASVIDLNDSGGVVVPLPELSLPFRNPFIADGFNTVKIPVKGQTRGTLSIFSTSMDFVYSSDGWSFKDKDTEHQVFSWNGKDMDGRIASSGIYVYVLVLPNETLTGKIALIRR